MKTGIKWNVQVKILLSYKRSCSPFIWKCVIRRPMHMWKFHVENALLVNAAGSLVPLLSLNMRFHVFIYPNHKLGVWRAGVLPEVGQLNKIHCALRILYKLTRSTRTIRTNKLGATWAKVRASRRPATADAKWKFIWIIWLIIQRRWSWIELWQLKWLERVEPKSWGSWVSYFMSKMFNYIETVIKTRPQSSIGVSNRFCNLIFNCRDNIHT